MNYFRSKKNTLCDYAITETFSKKEMLILSPSIYTRDLWRVMSKAMTENITNDWTQQDVYKRLARENILIVGGVCSGKTSLIEKLKHVLPHKIMDIGKLFRIIAYLVINDNGKAPINPDIKKIREGDSIEIERVAMALNFKINNIRSQFNGINIFFENEENTVYLYEINIEKRLYTVPIETLASIISKNKKVRKLLWKWMDLYAENNPGNIITGYSLSDTDTIKYRIINLRVEKREAAVRLINRGFNDFTNFDEAYNFIDKRNISDRIKETEQVIDGVYGSIIIDTTGFSSEEIKNELLKRLIETSKERDVKKKEQEKHGISRKNFEWQVNPFMEIIKVLSEDIFRCQAKKYKDMGISEFDLAIQTIIHLASKNMEDILKGYRSVQKKENALEFTPIKLKSVNTEKERIINNIKRKKITLNKSLVSRETKRQAMRLIELYNNTKIKIDDEIIDLPAGYMGNIDANPFGDRNTKATLTSSNSKTENDNDNDGGLSQLIVKEKNSGKKVVIKKVSREISKLYSEGFHYLHSFREDEYISFGAYLENDYYPFAWVSYSPIDRNYKKEMLNYLGMESHRFLEMTRAWNSVWSPKNTMSTLFNFAHKQLINEWKDKTKTGKTDKPLEGIVTSINGNLGFHASAFRGIGFRVVGLKPAKFNYMISKNKSIIYTPRRSMYEKFATNKISGTNDNLQYLSNKLPLLPTYEIVLLFDEEKDKELENKSIYLITENSYKNI